MGTAQAEATETREDMSHQTGAGLLKLLFQTTELMKKFRQARPVQAILRHVPVFQASMCRRKGMQQNTNPMKENTENIMLEVVILGVYRAQGSMRGESEEFSHFLSSYIA